MKRATQQPIGSTTFRLIIAVTAVILLAALTTSPAQAQTLTVLHTFTGGSDGYEPYAGVTLDPQGRIYGTTIQGGTHFDGVVFRLSSARGRDGPSHRSIALVRRIMTESIPYPEWFLGREGCFTEPPARAAREAGERFSACNLRQAHAGQSCVHGLRPSCTTLPEAPMAEIRSTATWPSTKPATSTELRPAAAVREGAWFSSWLDPGVAGRRA